MLFSRVLLSGLATLLLGCHIEIGDSARFHEDFHHSYKVASGARFALENDNGEVEIGTWEKDEVEINGAKHARHEADLQDIRIDIQATPQSIRVRVDRPPFLNNGGARFSIRLPKKMNLEIVKTTNGRIRVAGLEGTAALRTSNGRIEADSLTGKLVAETSNGSIELRAHRGDARLRTSNGKISGEIVKGLVDAHSSNGGIDLKLSEVAAASSNEPMRFETSNGNVNLEMDGAHELRARTSNSGITVRLPANLDANLRARTSNSRVDSDFDGVGPEDSKHKTLDLKVGKGGPVIDLSTSNGHIRILKS